MYKDNRLWKKALVLSIITISYNFIEGAASIFFGAKDETLVLLGFGIDSIVEVVSGIGILHMLLRMHISSQRNDGFDENYSKVESRDKFEKTALSITGYSFYVLTLGLIAGSAFNLIENTKPNTTFAGIIISSVSILTMYWLMKSKLNAGRKLKSDAVIADANCTKTCFYLSIILLAASLLYEIAGVGFIDIIGSLGIAYFTFKEGKESLEKAKSGSLLCNDEECESELKENSAVLKKRKQ